MTRRRLLCGLLLASVVLACFVGWLWIGTAPRGGVRDAGGDPKAKSQPPKPEVATVLSPSADDKPSSTSAAQRLAAIQKEHDDAKAGFNKAVEALAHKYENIVGFDQEYPALEKAYKNAQAGRFLAAVEIARADPTSAAGFDALEWVLTDRETSRPAQKPALELMTEHHAANPKIGKVVALFGLYLRFSGPQLGDRQAAAARLIDTVAEKNPDRTARAQALFARAWGAKARFALAEEKNMPDMEKFAGEAEKAFEAVLTDYADCPLLLTGEEGRRLGDEAKQELFDLRHLRIGKVAPDIEGEDIDGVKFKLRDYRGKVVVLSFWGDW
jgi:hypothetical protein